MGNMARDRCRCSGGGAASRRSLIFAILLAFDLLLASAVVAADAPQSNGECLSYYSSGAVCKCADALYEYRARVAFKCILSIDVVFERFFEISIVYTYRFVEVRLDAELI